MKFFEKMYTKKIPSRMLQGYLYYVVIIYCLRINKMNASPSPKTLKPTSQPLLELPRLFFEEGVVLGARFPSSARTARRWRR